MARFDRGWCQFPRKAIQLTRKDPLLRAVLCTLCAWANVEDSPDNKNGAKLIQIRAGQLVTSAEELANDLDCERKTVTRKLKLLVAYNLISLAKAYRGVLITVLHLSRIEDSTNLSTTKDSRESRPGPVPRPVPRPVPDLSLDLSTAVPRIEEKEKEITKEEELNARAREDFLSGISNSIENSDAGKRDTSPEAGHEPPIDPKTQNKERQGEGGKKPQKFVLDPEMTCQERRKICEAIFDNRVDLMCANPNTCPIFGRRP